MLSADLELKMEIPDGSDISVKPGSVEGSEHIAMHR
jgi:hypothetical protein